MTEPCPRRWFQVSLKSLFLATTVAATFCGGYSLGDRNARREAERQAAQRNNLRQIGLAWHIHGGDTLLFLPPAGRYVDQRKNADDDTP
jgi:hypothetical protein